MGLIFLKPQKKPCNSPEQLVWLLHYHGLLDHHRLRGDVDLLLDGDVCPRLHLHLRLAADAERAADGAENVVHILRRNVVAFLGLLPGHVGHNAGPTTTPTEASEETAEGAVHAEAAGSPALLAGRTPVSKAADSTIRTAIAN